MPQRRTGLLPALLKHWRSRRGLSQLDLALTADVSSRHVSFIETGRSVPSPEMILRLAAVLDVPLRSVNTMLRAAGHEALYPEPDPTEGLPSEIADAIGLMKKHHDPFPLLVLDRAYNVLDLNDGAAALVGATLPHLEPSPSAPLNLARLTFDPRGAQPHLTNFPEVGRTLLWRIQREVLEDPGESALRDLLDELLALPTVPDDWRTPDLAAPASPTLGVHLRFGEGQLRFITTITAFQAPQTVPLDELRIETWFPADPDTTEACRLLTVGPAG